MSQAALRLLQGFLGLLKLADLLTSPLGLAVTLWLWLYLTLPYNTALGLWLVALVPLLMARGEEVKE
jgi:ABC-type multidrug transport system permease subunit